MQLVGTGFPGSRYSRAIAKVKDLVERSEAGDMKARSDLIHAAEIPAAHGLGVSHADE